MKMKLRTLFDGSDARSDYRLSCKIPQKVVKSFTEMMFLRFLCFRLSTVASFSLAVFLNAADANFQLGS